MSYNQQSGFGGFSFFPPMIKMLLLVNVGIFLTDSLVLELLSFRGMSLAGLLSEYFALQPLQSGSFFPWQLISYQFLHAGFSHIFFNLFALWMFGAELEQVMGSRRFIVFYLLSGIGGGIVHLGMQLLPGMEGAPTVGASGAIMGVLLAFGFTFPDRPIMMFPLFIPIPAKIFVLIYASIDLFSGLFSTSSGIAHFAHLGGAFFGYFLMKHGDDLHIFSAADRLFNIFSSKKSSSKRNIIQFPRPHANIEIIPDSQSKPEKKSTGLYFEGKEITSEEIDIILEKITAKGFSNLTDREKKMLYEVSKTID
jgi:membrane associated rhomboid family serine protease